MARLKPRVVVVTCEHASCALPREAGGLGLGPEVLRSHVAWDPGALALARALSRRLTAPLHAGRISRLWVDLNRSESHPRVVPRVAFGVEVPGNRRLAREEVRRRIEADWRPWREAALADLRRAAASPAGCVHLSAHSFTPVFAGRVRAVDVGLLYDPSRPAERALADRIAAALASRAPRLCVRRNQPYRGTADGFTTACRRELPAPRYVGIEIELNQALLVDPRGTRRVAARVVEAVADAVG